MKGIRVRILLYEWNWWIITVERDIIIITIIIIINIIIINIIIINIIIINIIIIILLLSSLSLLEDTRWRMDVSSDAASFWKFTVNNPF